MDHHGYLYASDFVEHEVRRYTIGDENGIVLSGRNGEGNQLNQPNCPSYLLIDEEQAVYLSGENNYRLMKWNKDANQGIVVYEGQGNGLTQLYDPRGLFVDTSGTLYVADHCHCLAVHSPTVLLQDTVIVSIDPRDCKKRAIVENVYSIQCSSSLSTDSLSSCDLAA